jgi:hypothetical protein
VDQTSRRRFEARRGHCHRRVGSSIKLRRRVRRSVRHHLAQRSERIRSTNATRLAVSSTGAIEAMTTFTLTLDLAETSGNPAAQSARVCELIRVAAHAIGSDHRQRFGEIKTPTFDAIRNTGGQVTAGSWAFTETRNPDLET